ncbi:MAG: hypothetical protein ACI4TT_00375, partial [Christensenellales bacterium]
MKQKELKFDIYSNKQSSFKLVVTIFLFVGLLFSVFSNIKNLSRAINMFTYDRYLQSLYQIKQEQGVKGLQNINADCIAYMECEDLDVYLPIVKTENKQDEQFYLEHDFKKKSNEFGSPYQRSDSQFGITDNAVFEGHSSFVESLFNHKKNQTIFGAFNNYLQKNSNYNYQIKVETPTQIFTYKFVSAIYFNAKSTDISK